MKRAAIFVALISTSMLSGAAPAARPAVVQDQQFVRNIYLDGPMLVSIKTRDGEPLAAVDVSTGVELSLHLTSGSFNEPKPPDPMILTGNVVIHTLPIKRLENGSSLSTQMTNAPFTLDLRDAVVTVTRK